MPRENSFTDSEGRSLTPDPEDGFASSPTWNGPTAERLPEPASVPRITPAQAIVQEHAKRSTASPPTSPIHQAPLFTTATQRPTFATPKDRFRATVRKVMALHRTSSIMSRRRIGAEPGIDPRRSSAYLNYGHIHQRCLIEVNDYSAVRTSFGRMTNEEFVKLLQDGGASKRDQWVKVRWINIGGISWDVISALALKYDLHPLALEDVLSARGHARSKADYYSQHLFIRVLNHTLGADEDGEASGSVLSHLPRSESPTPMGDDSDDEEEFGLLGKGAIAVGDDEKTVYGGSAGPSRFSTMNGAKTAGSTIRRRISRGDVEAATPTAMRFSGMEEDTRALKNKRNRRLVKELKRGDRVNVKIHPMCLFLLKDGTVISIHKDDTLNFTSPISERLRQQSTGLRSTADPSLLIQSLLDLVVDQALEVVEEYQSRILKIEQAVLLRPSMKTVRRLHILQGDLILHKRTLEPIKTVIYGLRRYDVDRAMALRAPGDERAKEVGYMSHKSKIYLADVHDHMEYILTSLDMIAGITENLINYTFNMASYDMNEVMRRLTLTTIICLPLTLLTGYFGMNFQPMWSVNQNSDLLFWEIALPVMAIVLPLFLMSDLKRAAHHIEKKMKRRAITKAYKRT